ncbi:transposable element Tcb2 transposase [Trichonephila clavipes]|uniref:Transposable element Tcb2 transposase n=1 Tax=Trichonephila clavipes TaxID=2585209 RepID=A0A8X6V954_TRICX|nr:transposable element Tcb2 transposase [Trichonephila clavipes]
MNASLLQRHLHSATGITASTQSVQNQLHAKKSPGRLHTWKNDRKTGGGAYRHQCSCRVRNQQKCRFARLDSVPNHRYSCKKGWWWLPEDDNCRRKEADVRGLFARRPERCLPLKVDHRRHRLQWCRKHKNWTTDQWIRVLFADESRFSTGSDSQRVLIWREIGTRFYTSNIKERHHYGGPGVLVWGGIMLNGRIELQFLIDGL